MTYPRCGSEQIAKNGHTHYGKQRFKCFNCVRQLVLNPRHQPVSQATRDFLDKLLLERVPLAGIVRVTEVSARWLQSYVNQKYNAVTKAIPRSEKKRGYKKVIQSRPTP